MIALQTLTAALDQLRRTNDAPGTALAAAALLITGQALSNYRLFREHAEALAGLRDGSLQFVDREDDLVAQAGLLCALLFLNPSDDAIDGCVARIMALLELDLDVNVRYAAGRLVVYYTEPREMRELGQRVYSLLQPLAEHPELTPHRLGRWLILWVRATANAKDPRQHRRAREQVRELFERYREPEVAAWMFAAEIEPGLRAHDFTLIERALASIEAVSDPANLSDMRRLSWLKGRFTHSRSVMAMPRCFMRERARRYAEELELPPPMFGVLLALEAQAKVLVGDYAGARGHFKRTAEIVAVLHAEEMRDMIRMVDAYEAFELRRPDARALLATAFAAPRVANSCGVQGRQRQHNDKRDAYPPRSSGGHRNQLHAAREPRRRESNHGRPAALSVPSQYHARESQSRQLAFRLGRLTASYG